MWHARLHELKFSRPARPDSRDRIYYLYNNNGGSYLAKPRLFLYFLLTGRYKQTVNIDGTPQKQPSKRNLPRPTCRYVADRTSCVCHWSVAFRWFLSTGCLPTASFPNAVGTFYSGIRRVPWFPNPWIDFVRCHRRSWTTAVSSDTQCAPGWVRPTFSRY